MNFEVSRSNHQPDTSDNGIKMGLNLNQKSNRQKIIVPAGPANAHTLKSNLISKCIIQLH